MINSNRFNQRLLAFVKNPFFWVLTVAGNAVVLFGATALYFFESPFFKGPFSFLDAITWSVGIVSTVGYGNYVATTTAGKITVIFLMMAGTVFIWTYMAFWVTGLIAPELATLEKDVHEVEEDVKTLLRSKKGSKDI